MLMPNAQIMRYFNVDWIHHLPLPDTTRQTSTSNSEKASHHNLTYDPVDPLNKLKYQGDSKDVLIPLHLGST